MNKLEPISLPASVRQHLELAQRAVAENRPNEAAVQIHEAYVTLARAQPEMFALLLAGQMGFGGICVTQTVEKTWLQMVDKRFLGITYSSSLQPMTERTTTSKTISLMPRIKL